MNLIRAQEHDARLVRGAGIVRVLSTMLHSIGVGNMTPASVPMVP